MNLFKAYVRAACQAHLCTQQRKKNAKNARKYSIRFQLPATLAQQFVASVYPLTAKLHFLLFFFLVQTGICL